MTIIYASPVDAFLGQSGRVLALGHAISRRTDPTRELVGESFVIQRPTSRCIVTPNRNNNIAAAAAEAVWMLAGRDDIRFLAPYLPRAASFSDDGLTWRGAYGPRLRHSFGVDQLDRVRSLLLEDRFSRRAVASLFDPRCDYDDTKDVPCNNWLQFMCVDDALEMYISARSIDLVWGFSGIDAFQWSVLQELMASWVGLPVGRQHWFIGSCHIYQRHLDRVQQILAAAQPTVSDRRAIPYAGTWESLADDLQAWFTVEDLLRYGGDVSCTEIESLVSEPLLRSFAVCVAGFWDLRHARPIEKRLDWLAETAWARALEQLASWLTPIENHSGGHAVRDEVGQG